MIKKQNLYIYLFIAITFIFPANLMSADFYQHCLLPGDFGSNGGDNLILSPLNHECQRICKNECSGFSRKFEPYKMIGADSQIAEEYSIELNDDIIIDCMSKCQKGDGENFSARYFEAFQASCDDEQTEDIFSKICVTKDNETAQDCTASITCNSDLDKGYISFYKTLQTPEASTGMICNYNSSYNKEDTTAINPYKYNAVKTSYTVVKDDKFNITFVGGVSDNTLFLCGKKRIKVVPIFNSTEGSS
ncbi:MAG: hypothetical protein ACI8ZF_000335, partial [Candidatus Midichloriaceae bacterium]